MAAGTPLDDNDRGPWLKVIRSKAEEVLQIKSPQNGADRSLTPEKNVPGEEKRRLAEVFETSSAAEHPKVAQQIKEADSDGQATNSEVSQTTTGASGAVSPQTTHPRAVLIACSSLKKIYRELLRGQRDSLTSSEPSPSAASSPLRVLHLYVRVSPEELLRRMKARKGHFMKEEMLKSQLATLEQPLPEEEEGIISLEDGSQEDVEKRAEQALREVLGV